MPTTLSQLQNDVDNIVGIDLEDTERDRLINEGYVKLVTESEWLQARLELGPTTAGVQDYPLSASVARILKVKVAGTPLALGSEETHDNIVAAIPTQNLVGRGFYWIDFNETAEERLSLYPTPTSTGDSISALCVVEPEPMAEPDAQPKCPERFRSAIRDYVAGQALGLAEDNAQQRAFYEESFARAVDGLMRLRNNKAHRGVVQVQIAGRHF